MESLILSSGFGTRLILPQLDEPIARWTKGVVQWTVERNWESRYASTRDGSETDRCIGSL